MRAAASITDFVSGLVQLEREGVETEASNPITMYDPVRGLKQRRQPGYDTVPNSEQTARN